jgi:hypothetical protein
LRTFDAATNSDKLSDVFLSISCQEEHKGREIVDVLYTLTAHPNFVSEVMAANARQRDHRSLMKTGA